MAGVGRFLVVFVFFLVIFGFFWLVLVGFSWFWLVLIGFGLEGELVLQEQSSEPLVRTLWQ